MSRPSSGLDPFVGKERMAAERLAGRGSLESEKAMALRKDEPKLRGILQHFFSKAALTIVSSRCDLPPAFSRDGHVKKDKWFNLDLPDSDLLANAVTEWASADIRSDRAPAPMIIEIYLDTEELSRNQTLVAVDERKRRWDVRETLGPHPAADASSKYRKESNVRVVLERWKLSLGEATGLEQSDPLPIVYKKALVMFRCLLTYAMLRPAYRFFRNAGKQSSMLNTLRPVFRIVREPDMPEPASRDPLTTALWPRADSVTRSYRFDRTHTFLGAMGIEVTYRKECDFVVDNSEALLSSQFRGMDDQYFKPSLGTSAESDMAYVTRGQEPGSLPMSRHAFRTQQAAAQAPASLSTFHRAGAVTGTSPMSTLRAARDMNAESPPSSPPPRRPPVSRPGSSSRMSNVIQDAAVPMPRRTSVSFQPFKAGSLSSSPSMNAPNSPTSRPSSFSSGLVPGRSRTTSSAAQPTNLRSAQPAPELAVGSPSSASPKAPPISRYSSSFQHRKRWSSGGSGTHRLEEDNTSSGRASQVSSNQPGSGLLNENEASPDNEPQQTDDDNISEFLKLVEQNKDLKSFNRTDSASRDASARRTTAALSKFHRLRDSHTALTESLSSSLTLQRSSSNSSRQLSSVPPALVGASVSTSSSPSKPISPHTPHTPAVPSRLSVHAPITASSAEDARGRADLADTEIHGDEPTIRTRTPGAIDIPTSPQRIPHIRRSSSVRNRHRSIVEDEFGMRSTSVPGDRPELSLSELLRLQDPDDARSPSSALGQDPLISGQNQDQRRDRSPTTPDIILTSGTHISGTLAEERERSITPASTSGSLPPVGSAHGRSASGSGSGIGFRPRLLSRGRGGPAGVGSAGSSFERSRYSFSARRAGDRDSTGASASGGVPGLAAVAADDDEPLLFAMSEIGEMSNKDRDKDRSRN